MLHRSDPRTKIVLAVIFAVAVYRVESSAGFLVLVLSALLLASRAGKPVTDSLRGLRPILCLALFAAAFNAFLVKGTPVADYGILRHVSREGVGLSLKMGLRLFLLVSGASLLTGTTAPLALTDGLERLMKPLKRIGVPVHEIAMMMSLALRFVPALAEEAEKVIKAQTSRSAEFATGNLLKRTRSYLPLLVPLFAGALRRGDELATAMDARCYRGGMGRSRMRQMAFSGADFAALGTICSLVSVLALVEYLSV
jgi:energy-coupling factor transport system permease protein